MCDIIGRGQEAEAGHNVQHGGWHPGGKSADRRDMVSDELNLLCCSARQITGNGLSGPIARVRKPGVQSGKSAYYPG